MKATLDFTLPEEREEFKHDIKGIDYICAFTDFDNWLRTQLKHGNYSNAEYDTLEKVRDKLYEICNDKDFKIWD